MSTWLICSLSVALHILIQPGCITDEYEIDKSYDGDLRNKIKRFKEMNNCRKSIQLTLITTYGVKKNKYSNIIGKCERKYFGQYAILKQWEY